MNPNEKKGASRPSFWPGRPFFSFACVPFGKARMTGLEPATSGVTGRCSNQLSYIPSFAAPMLSGDRIKVTRAVPGCQAASGNETRLALHRATRPGLSVRGRKRIRRRFSPGVG